MENTANRIELRGELAALPELSHENHGRRFYRLELRVARLSGTEDRLPVIAPADVLEQMDLFQGSQISVIGQIRSYNARAVDRRTPLGREICDVMLAVNRLYRRCDYLPCILWGRSAQEVARAQTGARLELTGRLQSRKYTKVLEDGSEVRTAYEISALSSQLLGDLDILRLD